jgi:hypothetical protein
MPRVDLVWQRQPTENRLRLNQPMLHFSQQTWQRPARPAMSLRSRLTKYIKGAPIEGQPDRRTFVKVQSHDTLTN